MASLNLFEIFIFENVKETISFKVISTYSCCAKVKFMYLLDVNGNKRGEGNLGELENLINGVPD